MIATPHRLATAAGVDVLARGGTAVDACVAANAVLTVVAPDQTAIGGDCLLMVYDGADGSTTGLNGSGRSPLAADRGALLAAGWTVMPARGIHAVTVPGTIDAWFAASQRWGRLEMAELLAPAIALARDGFPVSRTLALSFQETLAPAEPWTADLWPIFAPSGVVPVEGDTLRLPDLAATLELIAREGRDAFYDGPIAEAIVATSDRLGGAFTREDLAGHRTEEVAPVATSYRDITLLELPPNSQGITASIGLNLVEQERLGEWGSGDHLHPLIEAKKLAFAIRDGLITDPAFAAIDVDRLVSKRFARGLWRAYDPAVAGLGQVADVNDTVSLCAVDRDGTAASMIQSVYLGFGSGVVAAGTGVVLQCRGASFTLDPTHPNRLEGGKRPMHTLMPGMLLRGDRLWGPFGTQGGDAQAQVHLQLVTNLVDFGMDPAQAIDAPRWVAGGRLVDDPRTVWVEGRMSAASIEALVSRRHQVGVGPDWDPHAGHAAMVLRGDDGTLVGAADPRTDGTVG